MSPTQYLATLATATVEFRKGDITKDFWQLSSQLLSGEAYQVCRRYHSYVIECENPSVRPRSRKMYGNCGRDNGPQNVDQHRGSTTASGSNATKMPRVKPSTTWFAIWMYVFVNAVAILCSGISLGSQMNATEGESSPLWRSEEASKVDLHGCTSANECI